jgi:flagellar biosynthesis anti-sigma factor FlgM
MEIEGRNPSPDLEAEAEGTEVAQKPQEVQPSGEGISQSTSSQKDLSIRSSDSQKLDELIRSAPDIRQAIVDKIKGEIESGNYSVKAEKIADKMISDGMLNKIK